MVKPFYPDVKYVDPTTAPERYVEPVFEVAELYQEEGGHG